MTSDSQDFLQKKKPLDSQACGWELFVVFAEGRGCPDYPCILMHGISYFGIMCVFF